MGFNGTEVDVVTVSSVIDMDLEKKKVSRMYVHETRTILAYFIVIIIILVIV